MMKEHNNMNAIKSHKKLYKSSKTWMVATLMTVGLASGVMLSGTTNVNADEVTPVQSAGTIHASQQAIDSEITNTQSDAQKQQLTIDSANAQLKDQQNQLSETQGQQSSAQRELDQAKQAQQAATQNDPAVKQAQADVNQAQQQVDNQQQVVNDAQTAVNNDSQNIQSATSAVSQASQAVDQARQTATDAINQAAAQQANEAQNKIDQLENQGKAQASQNLDNQINNVSGQVSGAQNDVNNTNSKISNLQDRVQNLQGKQDNTQSFDGFHYPKDAGQPGTLTDLTNHDNQYKYVSNPADEQVKIDDYANLSLKIQKELTIYAAQLVNSFGRELRSMVPDVANAKGGAFEPFMINDASLGEAEYAAQLYDQDNWLINQHGNHDTNALEAAAIKYGAYAAEMDGTKVPAVNESATGQILATDNRSTTLDKLKNAIFNAINNMLYDDANNGNTHMMSLAQVWHFSDGWHFGHDWVGLAFDKLGQLHIVFAENNAYSINYGGPIYKATNYDYSPYLTASNESTDHTAEINNLNSQISDLKDVLSNQQAHLTDLQNQLQNLQAQRANAQFELSQLTPTQRTEYTNARNTLNTIKNWKNKQLAHIDDNGNVQDALKKLASANNDLVSAKKIQTEDKTKLQQAKDNLAGLNQILAAKKSALDIAEQNTNTNQAVKNAQKKLDAINVKINDLQTAIKTTKATIGNAQVQLDKDNQKIADIKNGQNLVKSDTSKDEDNGGIITPTDLSKTTNSANHALLDTDNASISDQAGFNPFTSDNSTKVVNTATKTTIVLPATNKENVSAVSDAQRQNTTMTRKEYKAQQAKLPQTGNNDGNKVVIALGVLAGMFGFGLITKDKREF